MSAYQNVSVYRCERGHMQTMPVPPPIPGRPAIEPTRTVTCQTCARVRSENEKKQRVDVGVFPALYQGQRRIKADIRKLRA